MSLGKTVDELVIKEFYRGQRCLLWELEKAGEISEEVQTVFLEMIDKREERRLEQEIWTECDSYSN